MTIINRTLANHIQIVQALSRLSLAICRHETLYYDPPVLDLLDVLNDVNTNDEESKDKVISEIVDSGDIRRVSEELYNPSSDIFDDDYTASVIRPPKTDGSFDGRTYTPNSDDIQCTSVYRVVYDDRLFAEIKNYHTLKIVDYSETSLTYPILFRDDMVTSGEATGGRLDSPFFSDSLDCVGQIYNFYYPLEVGYRAYSLRDEIETSGYLYELDFPLIVGYQDTDLDDEMSTSPWMFEMSFPLEVAYIKYSMEPESIETSGTLYAMFFNL